MVDFGRDILFDAADKYIAKALIGKAENSEQFGGRWYVNPFSNTKFSTFAYTYIYYRLIDKFRKEIRDRNKMYEAGKTRSLYDETPERKAKWEIGNLDFLSDIDNRITKLKAENYTQEEIAEEVELSQGTVSKHLNEIKETLRKKWIEDKSWDKRNIYQTQHGHHAPDYTSPGEDSELEVKSKYNDDTSISVFLSRKPKGKITNLDKYPVGSRFYLTYTKSKNYNPDPTKIDFNGPTYQKFYLNKLEKLEREIKAVREDLENMLKNPDEIQSHRERIISTLHTIISEEEEKSRVKNFS